MIGKAIVLLVLISSCECGALSKDHPARHEKRGKDKKTVSGLGEFHVQLIKIQNINGEKSDGSCCDGKRSLVHGSARCTPNNCDTYFRICLQHYEQKPQTNGECTLGNATTPVLGGDTFSIAATNGTTGSPGFRNPISMHFTFSWLVQFNLIIEALDLDNDTTPVTKELIDQDRLKSQITPTTRWTERTYNGPIATIKYKYRVVCDKDYYGRRCMDFCKPRNDRYGHYTCGANGMKVCRPGWTGQRCVKAICIPGCDESHGYCNVPNQCICHEGWEGSLCDKCKPHPKCQHGTCSAPWTCKCFPGWGGQYCEKDLDRCRLLPCKNQGTCVNSYPGTYQCVCSDGYAGQNCEHDINECLSSPCRNNGTCENLKNNYHCKCPRGWKGRDCEINIDDCKNNICQHGGKCLDKVNDYECKCAPGWKGKHCETNIDDCSPYPCVHATNCTDLQRDFSCVCKLGWKGKTCNESVDDCMGQCQNDGVCFDMINDYRCACPLGFTGRDCEINVDDCLVSSCLNNGVCADGINKYRCVCETGFSGARCANMTDECASRPCVHGTCEDRVNDYSCHCDPGYAGTNCSASASPLNACHRNNSCKHGATCVVSGNNNTLCDCRLGYTGALCGIDIDDCASNPCLNKAKCVDRLNGYQCVCPRGYQGRRCDEDIDDCNPNPCHPTGTATCQDLPGKYSCRCKPGFTGVKCNHDVDYCAKGNPCQNGGSCVDGFLSYQCLCRPDFTGVHCEVRVQQCSSSPCENGGTCVDVHNGYTCTCPLHFTGYNCDTKIDLCKSSPCLHDGTCHALDNGFQCRCAPGYSGTFCETKVNYCATVTCYNGGTCLNGNFSGNCLCVPGFTGVRCKTDINECLSNPCKNNATCVNRINAFSCECKHGTRGTYCEEEINVCFLPKSPSSDNKTGGIPSNICGDNGDCHPLPGGNFTCTCHEGYTGERCHDGVDGCQPMPCQNGATCFDQPLAFKCQCKVGWEGTSCERKIDYCASKPCLNNGNCTSITDAFVCQCPDGWKGQTCNSRTSHCAGQNPCHNRGKCHDKGTTFSCECAQDWKGTTCEIPISPCDSNPCRHGGTCMGSGSNFSCICPLSREGDFCEIVVPWCDTNVCFNRATCINSPGSFSCVCAPGFTGDVCRVNINECYSQPCYGGGKCNDGTNSFTCNCTEDRYGSLCEHKKPDNCIRNHAPQSHNTSWLEECNTCHCNNGKVECTKIVCPPKNCISTVSNHIVRRCEESGTCEEQNAACLREPCPKYGYCTYEGNIDALKDSKCDTSTNEVTEDCAKVNLGFSKKKLPMGTLLPIVCRGLSTLDVFHRYAKDTYIKVTCGATPGQDSGVTVAVASTSGSGNAVKAAVDLAKYIKLASEMPSNRSNKTIIQIILIAITKVTVERPVLVMYRKGKETPIYLIPVIASFVFIAAFILFLVLVCWRCKSARRQRARHRVYEESTKLKRRDSDEGGVDSASEASRGLRKEGSFTELRDTEPEVLDISTTVSVEPTEPLPPSGDIEVLSPSLSPREHGARDEWRRREILNLKRKSEEEIIV